MGSRFLSPAATELAGKLGLELRFDQKAIEEGGISLQEQVVFSVKDATVDDLLRAVLSPAGLACRRNGKAVQVFPSGPH
jgi:predicted RecB family endonuclease